ncbi:MAG: hypothetical protein QFX32_06000 [Methanolinea sp.]|nr:hypothetical protein [Methanolinea sp.]
MGSDVIIDAAEVQVVLNLLPGRVEVKYPLYGFPLLVLRETQAGYSLSCPCTREDFERAREPFGECAPELPSYADLVQSVLAAGIARFANEEAFARLKESVPLMNREALFSPDTNMFYLGFPSRAGIPRDRYVVVHTVLDEIEAALNEKYSPGEISRAKRAARFGGRVLDELVNQKTKRSRLAAYNALTELERIRDGARLVRGRGEGSSDREGNDLLIVKALSEFQRDAYCTVVHLTADKNVADLCRAEGIAHFLFEYPHELSARECTPAAAVECIFRLAVACGVVKVGPVLLYGEFRGKGTARRSLKMVTENEALAEEAGREISLCRKLSALPLSG